MNYIYHLNSFLWLLQRESRLTPSHISLYLALFHHWNCNRFQNPFPLYKERLMRISGIGSKNTYIRCLKDLHLFGYIRYDPSLHKNHRPKVSLIHWKINAEEINRQLSIFPINPPEIKPLTVPDMGHLLARIGTVSGPDPVRSTVNSEPHTGPDPSPDIKQSINNENLESAAHTPDFSAKDGQGASANTATPRAAAAPSARPPSKDEVLKYFAAMKYPDIEALKFFAHYQSTGWPRGGNAPITDWQGAADKWMLNPINNNNDNQINSYAKSKFTTDSRPIQVTTLTDTALSRDDLNNFSGKYFSEELNTLYEIKIQNDKLFLYVNDVEISLLNKVAHNTLSNNKFGTFNFEKNKLTNITGFKLNISRVRNLQFSKINAADRLTLKLTQTGKKSGGGRICATPC